MSNTNVITNKLSHKSCYTSGGKCSTTDTIYAAECTRHSMIYVFQSSQKLNSRFNGHRSDVKVKPKACELSQHFHNNKECSIDRDIKVYILQDNVTGSQESMSTLHIKTQTILPDLRIYLYPSRATCRMTRTIIWA